MKYKKISYNKIYFFDTKFSNFACKSIIKQYGVICVRRYNQNGEMILKEIYKDNSKQILQKHVDVKDNIVLEYDEEQNVICLDRWAD